MRCTCIHARYHDANDPCKCGKDGCTLFQSPIFLDCCGLVRQVCTCMGVARTALLSTPKSLIARRAQVLRDLKQEFGFETGPWNQAYQFDTLPLRYDSWDQVDAPTWSAPCLGPCQTE